MSGSNGVSTEKNILFRKSRGDPTFSRGGFNFFRGGGGGGKVQMLISKEPI